MFIAENITKTVDKKQIIFKCSFTIKPGEIVGLFGPNGAGKSTSFYIMAGLIKPTSGRIILNDEDVTKFSLSQRARLGLRYLPQEDSTFGELTVYDNVLMVLEIGNVPYRERRTRVQELLCQMKIDHLAKVKARSLSGGERRRLAITRCLAIKPKYILLDEPTAALDPITINDLCSLIKEIASLGVGLCITDHNVNDILPIVNKAYVMYGGKIATSGSAEVIRRNELVRKIYLGER